MNKCKQCRKNFIKTKDRTTFCCHTCQARWAASLSYGKPRLGNKKGKTLTCVYCKKKFYVPRYRIKKGKAKYCSRRCLAMVHLPQFSKFKFQKTGLPHHTYKYITVNGKRIREHRHIMQQYLGRKLESWEHIHHIDNNPLNNAIDNLVVLSNSEHQKEEYLFRKRLLLLSFLRNLCTSLSSR
jgi:HNH endonuclease